MIELAGWFFHLLPQEMKGRETLGARFIRVDLDIVTNGLRRPESENTARGQ